MQKSINVFANEAQKAISVECYDSRPFIAPLKVDSAVCGGSGGGRLQDLHSGKSTIKNRHVKAAKHEGHWRRRRSTKKRRCRIEA